MVRKRVLIALLVITPLGFWFKLYTGPGRAWLNNSAAGTLYEVFWCLVVFFFWPCREFVTRIAVGVFVVTSLLEVLQLWHPWALEQIRATFLGRALIGTTFAWWDFPHYALGCALGWLGMRGALHIADASGLGVRALVLGVAVNARYPGKDYKETEQEQAHHGQECEQQSEREIEDEGGDH